MNIQVCLALSYIAVTFKNNNMEKLQVLLVKIYPDCEVFNGDNSSTHPKICMMDVIEFYISILSESPFRCTHSVGINIVSL